MSRVMDRDGRVPDVTVVRLLFDDGLDDVMDMMVVDGADALAEIDDLVRLVVVSRSVFVSGADRRKGSLRQGSAKVHGRRQETHVILGAVDVTLFDPRRSVRLIVVDLIPDLAVMNRLKGPDQCATS